MGELFNAFCALSAIEDKKPGTGMIVKEREKDSIKYRGERLYQAAQR
jgi:hypothetical protein